MIGHACRLFCFHVFGSLSGLLFATVSNAQYDPASLSKLPPYCRNADVFRLHVPGGNNAADIERWKKVMGGGFVHIHHYCWALDTTNRALFDARSKADRNKKLRDSLGEFDYVIERVDSKFPLLPEILTKKAENLFRLERNPEAVATLIRAIEIRSDYWPPYAALSDHYKQVGKLDDARNWLNKGLAASGDTKALERRLRELPPN